MMIRNITEELIKDYDFSPLDRIHALRLEKEEEIIKAILRQILKREPTLSDAKKCSIGYSQNGGMDYLIAYEGIHLGKVMHENEGTTFKVTFIPDDKYL